MTDSRRKIFQEREVSIASEVHQGLDDQFNLDDFDDEFDEDFEEINDDDLEKEHEGPV